MGCGCGRNKLRDGKREQVRALAKRYQEEHGGVVVFYRCSDYDFTELENFNKNGKTEIEYLI
jgi:hypothetical protein